MSVTPLSKTLMGAVEVVVQYVALQFAVVCCCSISFRFPIAILNYCCNRHWERGWDAS
jgi:hypothetical protein